MTTPLQIHKISERAPEFPCWMWDADWKTWWPVEKRMPSVKPECYTHWCHSATRPTVEPEQEHKPTYRHGSVELEDAPAIDVSQRLTAPQQDGWVSRK